MFFSKPAGVDYVYRGDCESPDFDKDDFSDGLQDLDLSGIIPINTKLVFLNVTLKSSAGKTAVSIMTKDYVGVYNRAVIVMQVIGIQITQVISAKPNADRLLELYRGSGVTWTILDVTVLGWLI